MQKKKQANEAINTIELAIDKNNYTIDRTTAKINELTKKVNIQRKEKKELMDKALSKGNKKEYKKHEDELDIITQRYRSEVEKLQNRNLKANEKIANFKNKLKKVSDLKKGLDAAANNGDQKYLNEVSNKLNYEIDLLKEMNKIEGFSNSEAKIGIPNVSFITLGGGDCVTISQLVGIDMDDKNVTKKRVTSGDAKYDTKSSNAVDGNERVRGMPFIYHAPESSYAVFEVKLDGPTTVKKVAVYNTNHCCTDRMTKHRVTFLDANKKVLWKSGLLKDKPVQIIEAFDNEKLEKAKREAAKKEKERIEKAKKAEEEAITKKLNAEREAKLKREEAKKAERAIQLAKTKAEKIAAEKVFAEKQAEARKAKERFLDADKKAKKIQENKAQLKKKLIEIKGAESKRTLNQAKRTDSDVESRASINKSGLKRLQRAEDLGKQINNDRKMNNNNADIKLKDNFENAKDNRNNNEMERISRFMSENEVYSNTTQLLLDDHLKSLVDNIKSMKSDLHLLEDLYTELNKAKARGDEIEINLIKSKIDTEESNSIQNNKFALDKLQEEEASFQIEFRKRNVSLNSNIQLARESKNQSEIEFAKKLIIEEQEYQNQIKLLFDTEKNVYLSPNNLGSIARLEDSLINNSAQKELRLKEATKEKEKELVRENEKRMKRFREQTERKYAADKAARKKALEKLEREKKQVIEEKRLLSEKLLAEKKKIKEQQRLMSERIEKEKRKIKEEQKRTLERLEKEKKEKCRRKESIKGKISQGS